MIHEAITKAGASTPASRYEPRRLDLRALLPVIIAQSALLAALAIYRIPVPPAPVQKPLIVQSFELMSPRPAEPEVEHLPDPEPQRPAEQLPAPDSPPPVVAPQLPVPVIALPTPTRPNLVVTPDLVLAAATAPRTAPPRQIAMGNLTSMIHAPAPRYPRESRRLREQGTVILELLLATDGTVQDIRVARSSGYARLDEAARDAIRRWRWSPTKQNGVAVQVRGTVEIPFVLVAKGPRSSEL